MDFLQVYQQGSGQMVNIQKSAIFFSDNCQDSAKEEMMQITGIGNEALSEKYLGLLTAVGRSTKEAFEHIPSRIRNIMGGWSEKKNSVGLKRKL
jgi:hypothetical protein